MISSFHVVGSLLIASTIAISDDAYAQSPDAGTDCYVPGFKGAASAAGAVAFMKVVNNGKGCGIGLVSGGLPVLGVKVTEQPAHGSVGITANRFSYTPAPGYTGQDAFLVVSEHPSMRVKVQATVLPN